MSNAVLAVVVCLATLSGAAAANEADTFRNPTAGFELTKPAEWRYINRCRSPREPQGYEAE